MFTPLHIVRSHGFQLPLSAPPAFQLFTPRGLHFSLDDLSKLRRVALPGTLAQIAVATGLGMGVAQL